MVSLPNPEHGAKITAAYVSLFSNLLLTVSKAAIGVLTGSVSVVSEGAHSASDLMASGLALYTVRISDRPPDATHAYGHGKIESMSALAQALLLFGVAAYIVYEAVKHILHHAAPQRVDWGIGIMVLSAILNIFVWRYVKRIAEQTDSQALRADAQDHRNDIFTAVGVLVGLVLTSATGWPIFDPLLAILVAVVIVHGAWGVGSEAFNTLVDRQLPQGEIDRIKKVLGSEPRVLAYHKLRTRKGGSVRHVDAHVLLEDDLTLLQAHALSEAIEQRIRDVLPNTVVTLHVEPFYSEQRHQKMEHGAVPPDEVRNVPPE